MRRFAIFATFLVVLVVIADSQPRAAASQSESVCVCMASKAALMMKSIKTMAATGHAKSSQPHLAQTASTAK
jgi:hypothetical protein